MRIKQYIAAGGIVVRDGQLLLLRKRDSGEIVLPKGHVEAGETLEAAAVRETREETGYQNLRVLSELGTLRADFVHAGRRVIRDETYFVLLLLDEASASDLDHDDAEQDRQNFEHQWTPAPEAAGRMSFEPARTFVRRAVEWLQAQTESPAP